MTTDHLETPRTDASTVLTLVRRGVPGERPAGYTRMISTDPDGPNDGDLFLTWDAGWPEGFPVHRALGIGEEAGRDWQFAGLAKGGVGAGGFRMQPSLYELPEEFSGLLKGTLLLTGQATSPDELTSNIVIFASNDRGTTWRPVSHIDTGGPIVYDPSPESTTTTIWEPELELIDGELLCFYSDERYKGEGILQAIVHRASRDLVVWSERVLDFGVSDRAIRPGMFVAAKNSDQDFALGVMEIVGRPLDPVNLLFSMNPTDWSPPEHIGETLVAADGTWLSGTPNLTWTRPPGAAESLVFVTGRFSYDAEDRLVDRAIVNIHSGRGSWTSIDLPLPTGGDPESTVLAGYSQTLLLTRDGKWLVQATTVFNDVGTTDVIVATKPFEGIEG
ncbi:MAG TPA: hypothetical protein VHZ98_15015 [Galbitalea sp.]|nr:hypothetical protein [Galbitalea sp.]